MPTDGSPVSLACFFSIPADTGRVGVRNEVFRVGAPEHKHLERKVSLGPLNQRHQIADQFGPKKIHRRGRNVREQNGPFLTHAKHFEVHDASL
jgi:hypothetical protein